MTEVTVSYTNRIDVYTLGALDNGDFFYFGSDEQQRLHVIFTIHQPGCVRAKHYLRLIDGFVKPLTSWDLDIAIVYIPSLEIQVPN